MTDKVVNFKAVCRKIDERVVELLGKDLTDENLKTIERLAKIWETFATQ
jgi:hypothetical protein